jgi:hypothetical protein
MNVEVSGCTLAPAGLGPCTGPTPDVCPGVFTGSDAADGTVYQCTADNVGVGDGCMSLCVEANILVDHHHLLLKPSSHSTIVQQHDSSSIQGRPSAMMG